MKNKSKVRNKTTRTARKQKKVKKVKKYMTDVHSTHELALCKKLIYSMNEYINSLDDENMTLMEMRYSVNSFYIFVLKKFRDSGLAITPMFDDLVSVYLKLKNEDTYNRRQKRDSYRQAGGGNPKVQSSLKNKDSDVSSKKTVGKGN